MVDLKPEEEEEEEDDDEVSVECVECRFRSKDITQDDAANAERVKVLSVMWLWPHVIFLPLRVNPSKFHFSFHRTFFF